MTSQSNCGCSSTFQPVEVAAAPATARRSTWTYRPSVDIFELADELLLVADIPGADGNSIDVALEQGILTVQARVPPRTRPGAQGLVHEFGVGNFHRRFEIDETIDAESVTAEYRDGSLTVQLPKARQARRRRIPVSS